MLTEDTTCICLSIPLDHFITCCYSVFYNKPSNDRVLWSRVAKPESFVAFHHWLWVANLRPCLFRCKLFAIVIISSSPQGNVGLRNFPVEFLVPYFFFNRVKKSLPMLSCTSHVQHLSYRGIYWNSQINASSLPQFVMEAAQRAPPVKPKRH